MRKSKTRQGFTLVEVMLAIMLLAFGLLSVLGLTLAGTRDAQSAMSLATAYGTARTALYEPALVDSTATTATPNVSGYLNGYYVVRTIDKSNAVGSETLDQVSVRIYFGESGKSLVGLNTFLRR